MACQAALLSRELRSPTLARGLGRRRDVPLCRDHYNMHATAAAMPAACRTHDHAAHRTRATRRRGRTRARAARAAHAHAPHAQLPPGPAPAIHAFHRNPESQSMTVPPPIAILPPPIAILPQPIAILPQPIAILPQPIASLLTDHCSGAMLTGALLALIPLFHRLQQPYFAYGCPPLL